MDNARGKLALKCLSFIVNVDKSLKTESFMSHVFENFAITIDKRGIWWEKKLHADLEIRSRKDLTPAHRRVQSEPMYLHTSCQSHVTHVLLST